MAGYDRWQVSVSMSSGDESDHSSHLAAGVDTGRLFAGQQAKKVKRTRQRVDAGEPRNSYATITSYSPLRPTNGYSLASPPLRPDCLSPAVRSINDLIRESIAAKTAELDQLDGKGGNVLVTGGVGGVNRSEHLPSVDGSTLLREILQNKERQGHHHRLLNKTSPPPGTIISHLLQEQALKQNGSCETQRAMSESSSEDSESETLDDGQAMQGQTSLSACESTTTSPTTATANPRPASASNVTSGNNNSTTSSSNNNSGSNNNNNSNSNNNNNSNINNGYEEDSVQAKRARVDAIVTSMRMSPARSGDMQSNRLSPVIRKPKRKQYVPQQQPFKLEGGAAGGGATGEAEMLRSQLQQLQNQLSHMKQCYTALFEEEQVEAATDANENTDNMRRPAAPPRLASTPKGNGEARPAGDPARPPDGLDPSHFIDQARRLVSEQEMAAKNFHEKVHYTDAEIETLAHALKAELVTSVSLIIDSIVARFVLHVRSRRAALSDDRLCPPTGPVGHSPSARSKMAPTKISDKGKMEPKYPLPQQMCVPPVQYEAMMHPPLPNGHPFFAMQAPYGLYNHCGVPTPPPPPMYKPTMQEHMEQLEAMSLVMPTKKKRHKVTDTRLSPRTSTRINIDDAPAKRVGDSPYQMAPMSLLTSVAIPNPSLGEVRGGDDDAVFDRRMTPMTGSPMQESPRVNSPDGYSYNMKNESMGGYDGPSEGSGSGEFPTYDHQGMPQSVTLTPMHLRKAKLMFFYVRYPSSAILKMFFPDIQFNRSNTAQLVKWFSNFREFFYIQMEKYARQSISEGVKTIEELTAVTRDSELFRVLNLHYNRNNHIEVPDSFRKATELTMREFFRSVISGKDTEQSWKKQIYKVIARMDDNIPEYFMSPNFLEQLE
ncbi:PREDICTED: prospero homeobox protein 1-like isoform X2 [Priapulus caudatus]|uniref:Prospero homeobox protein 1-like isoform X2 n=1 Tax=Priapulus caudatus TaxID=37621 RepID=A0ABM1E425_PRICU|nr:PREDICTED: prospero homeobox protein 1-like isoform X2 [Priapulus caudatus]